MTTSKAGVLPSQSTRVGPDTMMCVCVCETCVCVWGAYRFVCVGWLDGKVAMGIDGSRDGGRWLNFFLTLNATCVTSLTTSPQPLVPLGYHPLSPLVGSCDKESPHSGIT